jgi:hypothetical protein
MGVQSSTVSAGHRNAQKALLASQVANKPPLVRGCVLCRGFHDSMGPEITEWSQLIDHITPIKVISDSTEMSGVLQERRYGRTLSR